MNVIIERSHHIIIVSDGFLSSSYGLRSGKKSERQGMSVYFPAGIPVEFLSGSSPITHQHKRQELDKSLHHFRIEKQHLGIDFSGQRVDQIDAAEIRRILSECGNQLILDLRDGIPHQKSLKRQIGR